MVKKAHLAAILWIPTANPLHHNHNRYTASLEINAQSLDNSQINLATLACLKSVKMAQWKCNPHNFVMCVISMLTTIEENLPLQLSRSLKCTIDITNTKLYQWQPSVQWFWGKYTSLVNWSASYKWRNLQKAPKSITLEAVCTVQSCHCGVEQCVTWCRDHYKACPQPLLWPLSSPDHLYGHIVPGDFVGLRFGLVVRFFSQGVTVSWSWEALSSVHHILDQALFAHHWLMPIWL